MPDVFGEAVESTHEDPEGIRAVLYGTGERDVVGKSETIGGDGVNDAHFQVRLDTISVVEEIAIRNVDGTSSAWDTVPGNGIWAIAVYTGGNLRNRHDGSVRFAVEGDTTLDLRVADNGSIARGDTNYEVIIRFNDGTVLKTVAERKETAETARKEGLLSAAFHAPERTDLTSAGEALKGDGKADWRISLELSVSGTIISFIVRGDDGSSEWDTLPGNRKWLVAVTDESGHVLNESNGSVSIPVSGRRNLDLRLTDNGTIAQGNVGYKVIVVMSDGRILDRSVATLDENI